MAVIVDEALSEDALLEAAGEIVFERGEALVEAVGELLHSDGEAKASVHGTALYQVRLSWDQHDLEGTCTCPHFADGHFCKHLVAVGLAVLDEARGDIMINSSQPVPSNDPEGPVDDYLAELDAEQIRELVIEMASYSEAAQRALETAADLAAGDEKAVQDALMRTSRSVLSGRRSVLRRPAGQTSS